MKAGARLGVLLGWGLLLATLAPSASDAAGERRPVPSGPVNKVMIGEAFGGAVCQIGVTDLEAATADYIRPPDDFYYILLDPQDCSGCVSPDTIRIENVGIKLAFDVACTMPVRVSLIDINGLSCVTPCGHPCPNDDGLIWGPVQQDLVGVPGLNEFLIDVPSNILLTGRAFLRFEFYENGNGCLRPNLVFGPPQLCTRCTAFNLSVVEPHDDLCDPLSDPDGRPILFANVASCVTPALPNSWGAVKAIYRQP